MKSFLSIRTRYRATVHGMPGIIRASSSRRKIVRTLWNANMTWDILVNTKQRGTEMTARFEVYRILREERGWAYTRIGQLLKRHHTTIYNGVRIHKGLPRRSTMELEACAP
jgi:hypothetical protein